MQLCASKMDMTGDLSFNGFLFFHLDCVYFAPLHFYHQLLGSVRGTSNVLYVLYVLFYPITKMEQLPQRIRPLIELLLSLSWKYMVLSDPLVPESRRTNLPIPRKIK